MPKIAAFPKAYMNNLCVDGTMSVRDWLDIAENLNIDGVEWYAGFLENKDSKNWKIFRSMALGLSSVSSLLLSSGSLPESSNSICSI